MSASTLQSICKERHASPLTTKRHFAPPGLTIKLTPSRLRGALPPRNKNMFRPSGATIKQAPSRLRGASPPRNKNIFRPSGAVDIILASERRSINMCEVAKPLARENSLKQKRYTPLRGCGYHTSLGEAKYKHVRGGKAPRTRKLLKTKKIYAPLGLWISC